jgi:hypothetical protein
MATLTNILTQVTEEQLENLAITDLETELGIQLISFLETPLPVWPFIALGYAVYDILTLFGGGKPVTVDTDNVIQAYNASAYQPLRLLAADLTEMLRNGAPISDSRAAIQAQFGTLKQGTVESLQSLAGAQPGPNGDGYWQFFNLIQLSWQYAGNYTLVLDIVKAIDQFTIGLSQLEQQTNPAPPQPPTPPIVITPPLPTQTAPPCPPFQAIPDCLPQPGAPDPALDEIGQGFSGVAYWMQIIAIYVMNIFQAGAAGSGSTPAPADPVTCTQLTGLFSQLVTAIGEINISNPPAPPSPEPPAPVDLTDVIAALEAIEAALNNPSDDVAAQLKRIADMMAAERATVQGVLQKWASLGFGDDDISPILFAPAPN